MAVTVDQHRPAVQMVSENREHYRERLPLMECNQMPEECKQPEAYVSNKAVVTITLNPAHIYGLVAAPNPAVFDRSCRRSELSSTGAVEPKRLSIFVTVSTE